MVTATPTMKKKRKTASDAWLEKKPLDEATGCLVLELTEDGPGLRFDNIIRISIDRVRNESKKVHVRIHCPHLIKVLREELIAAE